MKKENKKRKKHIRQCIQIICIIVFVISISVIIYCVYSMKKEKQEYKEILNNIEIDETQITEQKSERMLQIEELKKENDEIIGWLEIEGTSINYPVLQGTDNKYYMNHTYKREESKNGSIFLDKDYNWDLPSSNLLLYGHNNRNGTMFEELMNYKEESYYKEHPTIRFTTETEDCTYEIISVFLSRVYYKDEKNVFRYYYFINAENEQEYNDYVQNCKKASLYNIEATAEYGEQLLTLSTCEYSQEDGRLAVVARKMNKIEDNAL